MTTECIHGLDIARCDLCSPRTPPPTAGGVAAPGTRARRAPAKKRSTSSLTSAKPATVDAGARRIFHITHRQNVAAILAAGRLLSETAGAAPVVDISASDNREVRREVRVGADDSSATVASHVPFFLAPNAFLWDRLRGRETDIRLAPEAHTTPTSDFVLFVSTVRSAGEHAVIADGDAADPTTRFFSLAESSGKMPRRLTDEEDAVRDAELLVPDEFPFTSVTLIGVANDKVRAEVRAALAEHSFNQKVSVYPPWFLPSQL